MRRAQFVEALRSMLGRPRMTSVAGVVALVLACSYVYMLLLVVGRDAAELTASGGLTATPIPEQETAPAPTPTATKTPTPGGPTATATRTPTFTPISYIPTPAFLVYTVQQGDTLSDIARRYNTTTSAIMELNSLRSDLLSIGQELLIPGQRQAASPEAANGPAENAPTPTATASSTPSPTQESESPTATASPVIAPPGAASTGDRPVVAFYYAWYGLDQWVEGKVPDIPAAPYASKDRNAIVRHVEQAQAAGIDAFAMAWYGPRVRNNQTETNLRTLLEVGLERGFRCTVDFETRSPFYSSRADVVEGLRYLINSHAAHPAFLRYEGKPIIFFWAVSQVFRGQGQSAVEAWASIRQQVDPEHKTLWIADGADIEFLRVFDGHHLYNITWNPPASVYNTLSTWGNKVRSYSAEHGTRELWVATVMPGYNDLYTQDRSGRFSHDRRGGAYYRETWEAAIDSAPDLIVITSFNEWLEGTQIEPSVSYGNLYLDLTSELSAAFKRGS